VPSRIDRIEMQEGGVCSIPTTEGKCTRHCNLNFAGAMHEIPKIISLGLTFSMLTGVEKKGSATSPGPEPRISDSSFQWGVEAFLWPSG
jgi:hypothetical protein